jgi:hypothetical protein
MWRPSRLKEEERAKLNVTLAYTLHSLYYVLLRSKVGLRAQRIEVT